MFSSNRIFIGVLSATILLVIIGTLSAFFSADKEDSAPEEEIIAAVEQDPFAGLFLRAKAAYVLDVVSGEVLFRENEEMQLPLASVTKVMTAVLAEEFLSDKDSVVVGMDSVMQEGDSGLLVGERWDTRSLIDFTLISSSNDGAHALASAVAEAMADKPAVASAAQEVRTVPTFAEQMNLNAREIGMRQTFFINESGLDVTKGVSGAYGSARDLALLLEYVLRNHPALLEATRYRKQELASRGGLLHTVENTNEIAETIPGIVASKTGFTELAGGNLAVVFEKGPMRPIIAVVLGSTADDRFRDIEKLVWAALQ